MRKTTVIKGGTNHKNKNSFSSWFTRRSKCDKLGNYVNDYVYVVRTVIRRRHFLYKAFYYGYYKITETCWGACVGTELSFNFISWQWRTVFFLVTLFCCCPVNFLVISFHDNSYEVLFQYTPYAVIFKVHYRFVKTQIFETTLQRFNAWNLILVLLRKIPNGVPLENK